jgi:hypothetical protein
MAASREWPDVQRQVKIADGVYGFTCAGHGGIVAVIGVADLPEAAVQAARDAGRIEFAVFDRGRALYSSGGTYVTPRTAPVYQQDSLREYAARRPDLESFEVWVAEEDCDWATVLYANDKLREAALGRYLAEGVTREDVEGCVLRWNTDWYEQFTGEKAPVEDDALV